MGIRVVAGVAAVVVGLVWIFRGLGAIDGYGMSGHGEWVLYGAILAIFGVALLVGARRAPGPRD
jgi:hypothetical protein